MGFYRHACVELQIQATEMPLFKKSVVLKWIYTEVVLLKRILSDIFYIKIIFASIYENFPIHYA